MDDDLARPHFAMRAAAASGGSGSGSGAAAQLPSMASLRESVSGSKRRRTVEGAGATIEEEEEEEEEEDAAAGGRPLPATTTTLAKVGAPRRFAGLANQGATCYMNSLLQTYYMTPEFRRAMFEWRHNPEKDGPPGDCIPYQMQHLLAMLQATSERAAETASLTKSFGWQNGQQFQQNDVQELARVLLDALERSFRDGGHPRPERASSIFSGELRDYVHCDECRRARGHSAKFEDLSLDVQPLGSKTTFESVDASLRHFLQPEAMEGVECPHCKRRTKSHKGQSITKLPHVLMLHVKRFTLDMTTFSRKKLNGRFAFPMFLDMNQYLPGAAGIASETDPTPSAADAPRGSPKPGAASAADKETGAAASGGGAAAPAAGAGTDAEIAARRERRIEMMKDRGLIDPTAMEEEEEEEEEVADDDERPPNSQDPLAAVAEATGVASSGSPVPLGGAAAAAGASGSPPAGAGQAAVASPAAVDPYKLLENGPEVYELYSIMIHSGGAFGGHYYAYIKDLETNRWHNFNDSSVTPLEDSAIATTFGGDSRTSYLSGGNAYMLAYRRFDPKEFGRRARPLTVDAAPAAEAEQAEGGAGDEAAAAEPTPAATAVPADARVLFPRRGDLPPYALEELRRIEEAEAVARREREAEARRVKVKVFLSSTKGEALLKSIGESFSMEPEATVLDLIKQARARFGLGSIEERWEAVEGPGEVDDAALARDMGSIDRLVPFEDCRLRKFQAFAKRPREPIPQELLLKTLGDAGITNYADLCLETKADPADEWPIYDADAIRVKCRAFQDGKFSEFVTFTPKRTATLWALRKMVAKRFGMEPRRTRILDLRRNTAVGGRTTSTTTRQMVGENLQLQKLSLVDNCQVAAEELPPGEWADEAATKEDAAVKAGEVPNTAASALASGGSAARPEEGAAPAEEEAWVEPPDLGDSKLFLKYGKQGWRDCRRQFSPAVALFEEEAWNISIRLWLTKAIPAPPAEVPPEEAAADGQDAPIKPAKTFKMSVDPDKVIRISMNDTFVTLKQRVAEAFGIEPGSFALRREFEAGALINASYNKDTLSKRYVYEGHKFFVDPTEAEVEDGKTLVKILLNATKIPVGTRWFCRLGALPAWLQPGKCRKPTDEELAAAAPLRSALFPDPTFGGWVPGPMTEEERAGLDALKAEEEAKAAKEAAAKEKEGERGQDDDEVDEAAAAGEASTPDAADATAAADDAKGSAAAGADDGGADGAGDVEAEAAPAEFDWGPLGAPFESPDDDLTSESGTRVAMSRAQELFRLPVSKDMPVADLRMAIARKLVATGHLKALPAPSAGADGEEAAPAEDVGQLPDSRIPVKRVRVRIVPYYPGEILRDGEKLGKRLLTISAWTKLAVELLPEGVEEKLKPNERVVVVRWLDRVRWGLSSRREMIVCTEDSRSSISHRLAFAMGVPASEIEYSTDNPSYGTAQFARTVWSKVSSVCSKMTYTKDGQCIVVSRNTWPKRELTESQLLELEPWRRAQSVGGTSRLASSYGSGTSYPRSSYYRREEGVKITTYAERQRAEAERQAAKEADGDEEGASSDGPAAGGAGADDTAGDEAMAMALQYGGGVVNISGSGGATGGSVRDKRAEEQVRQQRAARALADEDEEVEEVEEIASDGDDDDDDDGALF